MQRRRPELSVNYKGIERPYCQTPLSAGQCMPLAIHLLHACVTLSVLIGLTRSAARARAKFLFLLVAVLNMK